MQPSTLQEHTQMRRSDSDKLMNCSRCPKSLKWARLALKLHREGTRRLLLFQRNHSHGYINRFHSPKHVLHLYSTSKLGNVTQVSLVGSNMQKGLRRNKSCFAQEIFKPLSARSCRRANMKPFLPSHCKECELR